MASVLFIRFKKDGHPLGKLVLEIHRTIIVLVRTNEKNKDFSKKKFYDSNLKQTIAKTQTKQENYKRKPRDINTDTFIKAHDGTKNIIVSTR